MNRLYDLVGITRQAHHQAYQRKQRYEQQCALWIAEARAVRQDHPRMGMAKLYDLLKPPNMGRDRFIEVLKNSGLRLKKTRNYHRTTYSVPHLAYDNLIQGMRINGLNQLWVSDITYYYSGGRFFYLVFIMDVYSRRIVGHAASNSLAAESNLKALRRAFRLRKGQCLQGLIHHSDRGSQYVAHDYVKLLKDKGVQISMGNKAWENAHAERINRTIKNDYMYPKGPIKSLKSLQLKLKEQVNLYNEQRPHQNLPQRVNPVVFEQLAAQKQLDYQVTINY
jgi:putative transposase